MIYVIYQFTYNNCEVLLMYFIKASFYTYIFIPIYQNLELPNKSYQLIIILSDNVKNTLLHLTVLLMISRAIRLGS